MCALSDAPANGALRRFGGAARLVAVLVALLVLAAFAPPFAAQDRPAPGAVAQAEIEALVARAQAAIAEPGTSTETLDDLREDLIRARDAARLVEHAGAPVVADLQARIEALGAAPAEGESEAPEVARLRHELAAQLSAAQVPVLVAQEAMQRTDGLADDIDRIVRGRISAERFGHRPSPLLPATWTRAAGEIGSHVTARLEVARAAFDNPQIRSNVLRRLPLAFLLAGAGYAVAFILRWRLGGWIESRLAVTADTRAAGRLLLLRSLNRIIPPVLGAGLLFAALDAALFGGRPMAGDLVALLPAWVLALIVAGWLAGSFFAPNAPAYRIAPLETPGARSAARLTFAGGAVLATHFLVDDAIGIGGLSMESQSVLLFPLILVGALVLWRAARLVEQIAATLVDDAPRAVASEETGGRIGWWLLRFLSRVLRVIAVLAPPLAAVGYVAGADFFVRAALMTLALIAAAVVVHDLASRAVASLAGQQAPAGGEGTLIPVFVATLVVLACLPMFALIWGARTTDIREVWALLADGATVGGITISLNVLLRFIIAFGILLMLTRLLQSILVGSVLPRTKLDAGAREAARAGVGYIGFALAAVAGIGAAGLDLSNLAIVAGALSVGIGFGLQTIVSNFVSGIILLIERPIKPGDWIEVGGSSGYVRGIRVRSTEIETFDRASVIIPNSQLIAGVVLNRTHTGMSGRLQVMVSVAYDSDARKVEGILLDIAGAHPLLLEQPAPTVLLTALGPDSMDFELRCWLRDVTYSLSVRSDLNFEIVQRFAAEGIRMQFYGRDVRAAPAAGGDDA